MVMADVAVDAAAVGLRATAAASDSCPAGVDNARVDDVERGRLPIHRFPSQTPKKTEVLREAAQTLTRQAQPQQKSEKVQGLAPIAA